MRNLTSMTLAAAVLLTASACGVLGGDPAPSSAPPPASAPASAPASTPASAPASTPATGPASPSGAVTPSASGSSAQPTLTEPGQTGGAEPGPVVATRSSSLNGYQVDLKLFPVTRNGSTSTVNFSLTSPDSGANKVQIAQLLGDGNYSAIDKTAFAADGLQLVDGKNAKVYLVASDGQGQCLCSRNLVQVQLEKGLPALFSASFAAPPADVTSVDVKIPSFGTVTGVPVQ